MLWAFSKIYFGRRIVLNLATLVCATCVVFEAAADPLIRVGITPIEDRWISMPDGTKVFFGQEISYLLGHLLFQSGKFRPVLLSKSPLIANQFLTQSSNRIPPEWLDWVSAETQRSFDSAATNVANFARVDFVIGGEVQKLLFSSGKRSSRLVFGFWPKMNNPYGEGRSGLPENEFVTGQNLLDAQFDTVKSGINASTFGTNADEGFGIFIFGYGLGFKKKNYLLESSVQFSITDNDGNLLTNHEVDLNARGVDWAVAVAYNQWSLALEVQKRETLKNAITAAIPAFGKSLPQMTQSFYSTAEVIKVEGDDIYVDLGAKDNLKVGDRFKSVLGSLFEAKEVFLDSSKLMRVSGGFVTIEHEKLIFVGELGPSPKFSNSYQKILVTRDFTSEAPKNETLAYTDLPVISGTVSGSNLGVAKSPSLWGQFLENLLYLYGLWRYDNIFDQSLKSNVNGARSIAMDMAEGRLLKVGFLGTGVDYNDLQLNGHAAIDVGFDFISLDSRPSDDNGQGTAAAKLFARLFHKPWALTAIKVIGPHGETTSAAIYEGFKYAAAQKLDVLIVPWRPAFLSHAFEEGLTLAKEAGVKVFVPTTSQDVGPSAFTTTGLGNKKIKLDQSGVLTVGDAVDWASQ